MTELDGEHSGASRVPYGFFLEDLAEGMTAAGAKTITEDDVMRFADVSGDRNPLHLDEEYASGTRFCGRIVHGMLGAGLISGVLAMQLPGPGAIYVNQSLRFAAPVRVGDEVTVRVTITGIDRPRKRVTMTTICRVGDRVVIDGEAELVVPARA